MGLAASQARLLSLTARIHDVEYQAQMIQNAKLQLATLEDAAYKKYNEALDATTLTYRVGDARIPANFNNLCGLNSIDNGLNKYFIFKTSMDDSKYPDSLIVPDEVYEGYERFGGEDPYEFALFMLGADKEKLKNSEQEYFKNLNNTGLKEPLLGLNEAREKAVIAIAKKAHPDCDAQKAVNDTLYDGTGQSIEWLLTPEQCNSQDYKQLLEDFYDAENKFKYKLYNTANGAEEIYKMATDGREDFDLSKFNYYLRWGMLIKEEVYFDSCVKASDYGQSFGNSTEMLQGMLETGRIRVNVVSINNGILTDDVTSVASDSTLEYTTTTDIDKKELAKAEAEYEHAMKEIDRKDKRFDMDLNRLETERTALTTEYDSVKKVIKDNVERTFGIFS